MPRYATSIQPASDGNRESQRANALAETETALAAAGINASVKLRLEQISGLIEIVTKEEIEKVRTALAGCLLSENLREHNGQEVLLMGVLEDSPEGD